MYVLGPPSARLLLNTFVVVVGFMILAGAVNTALIGSNGVLNRVAEDRVIPQWFLKPHPRYGTTYRLLALIVGMQLITILASRGHVYVLGEAYAFGVVWSFVFTTLAMVLLRFKDETPREYKVPFNVRVRGVEIPLGLLAIFAILLCSAISNVLTKEVATIGGLAFTTFFLSLFTISERLHARRSAAGGPERLAQFNPKAATQVERKELAIFKPYCKLVSIRSTQNLFMLEKALSETDPEVTNLVVMTAKVVKWHSPVLAEADDLDPYDRELMTAVLDRAEAAGKTVTPLIVPTNNPGYAMVKTVRSIGAGPRVTRGGSGTPRTTSCREASGRRACP